MSSRTKYFVVSSSTCLTIALLFGSWVGKGASQDDTFKHIGVFSDVVQRIKTEYVEEPDMKNVTLGALNGMLEAIDPFASYLNAEQYRDYMKNKDVKRADIGLILSKKFGSIGVVGTIPNSPAAKAGLNTGDMIESINGVATRDMPLAYASMLLTGEANTEVKLSVVRIRRPEPQQLTLSRANLALPAVDAKMLPGNVGYIDVSALSSVQVKQVADAVKKLQTEGAKKFVVDVRSCATGSPDDGIALANLFLKTGHITYLQGQKVARQNFDADPGKEITDLPVVFLTNRGTADGAEIAAGAILGNKRGQVVGEQTYGDAGMRKVLAMDDGGAIILSVAKYYSPDGKAIQDNRITPGTIVADTEPQVDIDENGEPIPEAQQKPEAQPKKLEDDPVVKKALEVLGA